MLRINRWFVYIMLIVGAVVMLFPFYWMIVSSFKTAAEATQFPPTMIPQKWTLQFYESVFRRIPFERYMLNSLIMAVGSMVGVIVTSTMAGYAFARIRFSGKQLVFIIVLATMMVPPEVRIIPNFIIMSKLGWVDTYQGLILPFAANVFSIFIMRQSFRSIPIDLYDAALMDGASHWHFFSKVALPLTHSSIAVISLLAFMRGWNELLWPLIVVSTKNMRTLQPALTTLAADIGTEFPILMAASTLTILPILFLYLLAQRYFIEGIATTGLK